LNANELKVLLEIIDSRVSKKMGEVKFLKKYTGKVVQLIDSSKSVVKLAGEEENFTFPNKTGEVLNIGDNVYIETIGTDLNTGVISERLGFDGLRNICILKTEKTQDWESFSFVDKSNFCWKRISIEGTPVDGILTFTETLPFDFTEEPLAFIQGATGGDNFSQPISYSFVTQTIDNISKYTKINGKLYLKDNTITQYTINLFIIGKV
jgi:hypothetical protein